MEQSQRRAKASCFRPRVFFSSCPVRGSESQLQPELNLSRGCSQCCNASCAATDRATAAQRHILRQPEIRVVQNVEELRAELNVFRFRERKPFHQGKVNRLTAGAN